MATHRYISSVVDTALVTTVQMPWARGTQRLALIDKRAAAAANPKAA
ncbi:MAG: hypothetical protein ACPGFC_07745 [Paracoccaceae bacterium]